jgi:tetratricopeptide (TPR) repeat protein
MIASGSFEITDGTSPARGSSSSPVGKSDEKAADAAYNEAVRLTKIEKYREAIPYLDTAIRLNPGLLSAYALRGESYASLGDARRAIADYTTAIQEGLKTGLQNSRWYTERASSYRVLKEYQRALQDYNEALKIAPGHVTTIINRGELRRETGDLDGAIADLTRAIELKPKDATPYCLRGLAWLNKVKDAEAQKDFRRCSELDPRVRDFFTTGINKIVEERKRKP